MHWSHALLRIESCSLAPMRQMLPDQTRMSIYWSSWTIKEKPLRKRSISAAVSKSPFLLILSCNPRKKRSDAFRWVTPLSRKRFRMDGFCMSDISKEWLVKAEGDFQTALREYRARKLPNYDAVCFHAQQCIEKLFKAFLIRRKIAVTR